MPPMGRICASSPMSAPATNAFSPAPVTKIPRTWSSCARDRNARSISATVSAFRALSLSGRLIVRVATPSRCSIAMKRYESVCAMMGRRRFRGWKIQGVSGSRKIRAGRRRAMAPAASGGRHGAAHGALDHPVRVEAAAREVEDGLRRHRVDRGLERAQLGQAAAQQEGVGEVAELRRVGLAADLPRTHRVALRARDLLGRHGLLAQLREPLEQAGARLLLALGRRGDVADRKSTRLNSSHVKISYAVFCLK